MKTEMKQQQRAEMKLKLSGLRERSKHLLSKHNWQKYFEDYQANEITLNSSSGCSSMATTNNNNNKDLFKLHYKKVLSAIDIDLSLNINENITNSVISTVKSSAELSNIGFDASTLIDSQTKFANKMFQTPVMKSKSKICATLFNFKKKIYFDKEEEIQNYDNTSLLDKEVSFICRNQTNKPSKQQKQVKKNDSLTFIADLVSTSTPTRKSPQPITSTPKQTTHNPFKYHPTQTIRNKKQQKKQQQQANKKSKRFASNSCSIIDCTTCKVLLVNKKEKKFQFVNIGSRSQRCFSQAAAPLFNSCDTCNYRQQQQQQLQQQEPKINKITMSTKRKLIANNLNSLNNNNNKKLKLKSLSNNNFEISLADLLYTPSKLRDLVNASNNRSIKSSVAVKSAPVISSQAVAALAKIYYL